MTQLLVIGEPYSTRGEMWNQYVIKVIEFLNTYPKLVSSRHVTRAKLRARLQAQGINTPARTRKPALVKLWMETYVQRGIIAAGYKPMEDVNALWSMTSQMWKTTKDEEKRQDRAYLSWVKGNTEVSSIHDKIHGEISFEWNDGDEDAIFGVLVSRHPLSWWTDPNNAREVYETLRELLNTGKSALVSFQYDPSDPDAKLDNGRRKMTPWDTVKHMRAKFWRAYTPDVIADVKLRAEEHPQMPGTYAGHRGKPDVCVEDVLRSHLESVPRYKKLASSIDMYSDGNVPCVRDVVAWLTTHKIPHRVRDVFGNNVSQLSVAAGQRCPVLHAVVEHGHLYRVVNEVKDTMCPDLSSAEWIRELDYAQLEAIEHREPIICGNLRELCEDAMRNNSIPTHIKGDHRSAWVRDRLIVCNPDHESMVVIRPQLPESLRHHTTICGLARGLLDTIGIPQSHVSPRVLALMRQVPICMEELDTAKMSTTVDMRRSHPSILMGMSYGVYLDIQSTPEAFDGTVVDHSYYLVEGTIAIPSQFGFDDVVLGKDCTSCFRGDTIRELIKLKVVVMSMIKWQIVGRKYNLNTNKLWSLIDGLIIDESIRKQLRVALCGSLATRAKHDEVMYTACEDSMKIGLSRGWNVRKRDSCWVLSKTTQETRISTRFPLYCDILGKQLVKLCYLRMHYAIHRVLAFKVDSMTFEGNLVVPNRIAGVGQVRREEYKPNLGRGWVSTECAVRVDWTQRAPEWINDNDSCLITGAAGTGKTTLMMKLIQSTEKRVLVLTAQHSILCELRRTLGDKATYMTIAQFAHHSCDRGIPHAMRHYDAVWVDEALYCNREQWRIIAAIRACGVTVWMTGDGNQLPGIDDVLVDWELTDVAHWVAAGNRVCLTVVHRYDSRLKRVADSALRGDLNLTGLSHDMDGVRRHLCVFHHTRVAINDAMMRKEKTDDHLYIKSVDCDSANKPQEVWLFKGVPVSCIINNKKLGLHNKLPGVVCSAAKDHVYIEVQGQRRKVLASVFHSQWRVAYATTIHASQGLTINEPCGLHDIGAWDSRLGYVALTRVRCYEDVRIGDIGGKPMPPPKGLGETLEPTFHKWTFINGAWEPKDSEWACLREDSIKPKTAAVVAVSPADLAYSESSVKIRDTGSRLECIIDGKRRKVSYGKRLTRDQAMVKIMLMRSEA